MHDYSIWKPKAGFITGQVICRVFVGTVLSLELCITTRYDNIRCYKLLFHTPRDYDTRVPDGLPKALLMFPKTRPGCELKRHYLY